MNKKIPIVLTILLILAPVTAVHAISSEIHVTKDGKASISGAKIMQIAGTTFFARLYWGDAFMRFTIRANSTTKFLRGTGEATTIKEINEGDILDASGELEAQSGTMTLNASLVRNSSVQKEQALLSGTVMEVNLSDARLFLLDTKDRGVVTVNTATTTQFLKGSRTIDLEHLNVGDRVTKVTGDYDLSTKKLIAQSVTVYIDPNIFKPKNFKGKLLEAPSFPETKSIKVSLNKTSYTIFFTDKTLILNNKKGTTTLQRFIAGDSVRFYGAVREVDEPIIDAEVIRNTNL